MNHLPRIALGTVHSDDSLHPIHWALMNVLDRSGVQVQSFSSQSRCESNDAALTITGQRRRYLDSWLMEPDVCTELFCRGAQGTDMALVDGRFVVADTAMFGGGNLDTLCDWLDLPRVAVVNARRIQPCLVPQVPAGTEGIILDNVPAIEQLCRLLTMLEAAYGVPVVGAMVGAGHVRAAVAQLASSDCPSPEFCDALGSTLARHFHLDRFLEIAASHEFAPIESGLFSGRAGGQSLSVAIAHDEVFSCSFPDMLDALESQGAVVNFFSPLRNDSLPPGTDVVYIGNGLLEHYVNDLAANVCIKEALWSHVMAGGRIYAERAGLAYLCREVKMPCGQSWVMTGLLPALARLHPDPPPERALEVATSHQSWLFPTFESLRGYLDSKWVIHPDGCLTPLVAQAEYCHDLVGDHQIVGSRLHLNFAARPDFIQRFFQPCRPVPLRPVT